MALNQSTSYKGSPLSSLCECDKQIASFKIQIASKKREIDQTERSIKILKDNVSVLRSHREAQQVKLEDKKKAIAESDTVCLRIKNRLPYLSRKSIHLNIERLESQLHMYNYKPKDEELVLREITKLRNSLPLVDEYNVKVAENQKLRNEKKRLVTQRNTNYNKLQLLLVKEGPLLEKLKDLQTSLCASMEGLDKIEKEKEALLVIAKEKLRKRQQRKQKKDPQLVSENDAVSGNSAPSSTLSSIRNVMVMPNIYKEEISACRVLLSYMKSLIQQPKEISKTSTVTPSDNASAIESLASSSTPCVGQFYSKPQCVSPSVHKSKRKSKKYKGNKKEISHPPDVIRICLELNVIIPINVCEVPNAIMIVEEKLEYYESLNEQAKFQQFSRNKSDTNSSASLNRDVLRTNEDRDIKISNNQSVNVRQKDLITLQRTHSEVSGVQASLPSVKIDLVGMDAVDSSSASLYSNIVSRNVAKSDSDVESGVGEEEDRESVVSGLSQAVDDALFDETLSDHITDCSLNAPQTSVISENDPTISTDSNFSCTSSGCSSAGQTVIDEVINGINNTVFNCTSKTTKMEDNGQLSNIPLEISSTDPRPKSLKSCDPIGGDPPVMAASENDDYSSEKSSSTITPEDCPKMEEDIIPMKRCASSTPQSVNTSSSSTPQSVNTSSSSTPQFVNTSSSSTHQSVNTSSSHPQSVNTSSSSTPQSTHSPSSSTPQSTHSPSSSSPLSSSKSVVPQVGPSPDGGFCALPPSIFIGLSSQSSSECWNYAAAARAGEMKK